MQLLGLQYHMRCRFHKYATEHLVLLYFIIDFYYTPTDESSLL